MNSIGRYAIGIISIVLIFTGLLIIVIEFPANIPATPWRDVAIDATTKNNHSILLPSENKTWDLIWTIKVNSTNPADVVQLNGTMSVFSDGSELKSQDIAKQGTGSVDVTLTHRFDSGQADLQFNVTNFSSSGGNITWHIVITDVTPVNYPLGVDLGLFRNISYIILIGGIIGLASVLIIPAVLAKKGKKLMP
jgi:hypothetical protein